MTQGRWLRYLGVTFWNKGEPVLQPGNGERFGKRIESCADREDTGQMKNGEVTPKPEDLMTPMPPEKLVRAGVVK